MRSGAGARLRVWDDDDCRRLHETTLRLLAETGVEMHHAEARELCRAAGAAVEGTRVRLPRELVERALGAAPQSWVLPGRGRARRRWSSSRARPTSARGPTASTSAISTPESGGAPA